MSEDKMQILNGPDEYEWSPFLEFLDGDEEFQRLLRNSKQACLDLHERHFIYGYQIERSIFELLLYALQEFKKYEFNGAKQ